MTNGNSFRDTFGNSLASAGTVRPPTPPASCGSAADLARELTNDLQIVFLTFEWLRGVLADHEQFDQESSDLDQAAIALERILAKLNDARARESFCSSSEG